MISFMFSSLTNSAVIGQGPDSSSRNIFNDIFEFFCSTKTPTEVEDSNFKLSIRFLEHLPGTSPLTNQKKVCTQWKEDTYPLPKWLIVINFPFLSLKHFHNWAESSRLVFGHKFTFFPGWPPPELSTLSFPINTSLSKELASEAAKAEFSNNINQK